MNKKLNQVLSAVLLTAALLVGQTTWAQNPATIGSISYNSTLGAYEIASADNLHDLAVYVNGSGTYSDNTTKNNTVHDCTGLTFKMTGNIELPHTTAWNAPYSTEENYTPIGRGAKAFKGTFDGCGYTISGIRIYRTGQTNEVVDFLGLFGQIKGTVQNVTVSDARITGRQIIGGISGDNWQGTISNCTVTNTVCIHSRQNNAHTHGGIVGRNYSDTQDAIVSGCTSSVQFTMTNNLTGIGKQGGIVGWNRRCSSGHDSVISNCLVLGATIMTNYDDYAKTGAIIGEIIDSGDISNAPTNNIGTLTNNYYSNCTVSNYTSSASTNIGAGNTSGVPGDVTDNDGARHVSKITLPTGISVTNGTSVTIGSTKYCYVGAEIALGHNREGYTVSYASDEVTISESGTFTMPATDVTISATFTKIPVTTSYVDADGTLHENVSAIPLDNTMTTLDAGWYVVNSDINYTDRVTLSGDVNIILCDGKTMNIGSAEEHFNKICIYGPNQSLTIYGQSRQTGALKGYSMTGSFVSQLTGYTQHGGNITANNNNSSFYLMGDLTLNRGTITATVTSSFGIAISFAGNGHSVNMSGGTLTATSSNSIAINGDVNFTGGNLTATGGSSQYGYGISGNVSLSWSSSYDSFTCSKYNSSKSVTIADGKSFSNGEEELSGIINSSDYASKLHGKTLTPPTYGVTANQNPAAAGEYWSTFCHPTASYQVGTDEKAYIGNVNGGWLTLTEITDGIIPANTAVVLKATSGNFYLTRTAAASTFDVAANDLKGGSTVETDKQAYTLANGSNGVGFYKFTGTLNPYKAHLEINSTVGSRSFYGFDENTTAISAPESHASTELNGTWYTLEGRKLQGVPTRKGLYIVNGKKVVIK